MKAQHLYSLVACIAGALPAHVLSAQSNTVGGLDGKLTVVDNLTYWGRRGSAHPNGEVGMSMLNTMCNPGSVTIPWRQAMADDHPKFGFIITREIGGRMVQISDWSYCKHAFTSVNVNGQCGTCQNPGTGALMGLRCSDTYGAGNNADRYWLGPPGEIDPWLGVWNPVGSYFDRGDPSVGGAAAMDGIRSLTNPSFDSVKNRVTVSEQELLVANARYYYGIHLIHEGESDANRWDNTASRGFNPNWSGSNWSFSNNSVGQVYGSILQHWTGATVDKAKNGNDDGNFYVAVVVTPIAGGMYHYEYAVQNLDNQRGGGAFRVPFDTGGTYANVGFSDIDDDVNNDWTFARVNGELIWTAPQANPLNWNTIYNVWFDCDVAPSFGAARVDQARPGAGLADVAVNAQVPSGVPSATVTSVGSGCGGCVASVYEFFGNASGFDLSGSGATLSFGNGAYTVGPLAASYVNPTGSALNLSDDSEQSVNLPFSLAYPGGSTNQIVVCSNGFVSAGFGNGTEFTPTSAGLLGGSAPRWAISWHDYNPGQAGQVRVDSSAAAVVVTWQNVPHYGVSGSQNTFQIQFQASGTVHMLWQTITRSGNSQLVGWSRGGGANDPGNTDLSVTIPNGFQLCVADSNPLSLSASTRPVLGTSTTLTTGNVPAGATAGVVMIGFTQQVPPVDLSWLGMTGCVAHSLDGIPVNFAPASPSFALTIPNDPSLTGARAIAQSFVLAAGANPAGAVASNGLVMVLGPQ